MLTYAVLTYAAYATYHDVMSACAKAGDVLRMLTYADVCILTYAAYAAYHDVMSACAKAGDVQLALQVLHTLHTSVLHTSAYVSI
jgi:pentatricopeptide repeat protein